MKKKNLLKVLWLMLMLVSPLSSTSVIAADAYAVLSNDNTVLTFYYDDNKAARDGMNVGDGHFQTSIGSLWIVSSGWYNHRETITTVVFDPSFANCKTLKSTAFWFIYCTNLSDIQGISNLKTDKVTDMQRMFVNCSSLTSLDLSGFNTSNVTNMNSMFFGCRSLKSLDVSSFNTEKLEDMSSMFDNCNSLTSLDVSNFNTSNVTNMYGVFAACTSLTNLDVSNFNTSNVTNMCFMFASCSSLKSLDVSNFDTENVKEMYKMFQRCYSLTNLDLSTFNTKNTTRMDGLVALCSSLMSIDLSGFITSKVTNMRGMFSGCKSLTSLDLSSFTTENVKYIEEMFYNCSALTTIYCDKEWNTENVITNPYWIGMFTNCSSLIGGAGTKYDPAHRDHSYARIDGGAASPGYFTRKTVPNITPFNYNVRVDFRTDINSSTLLDGNVVDNVYYCISSNNGSYDSTEGCIVVNKVTDDSAIDSKDIFGEDFKSDFTGIVFIVPQGKGIVKVEAQTQGAMVLKAKFGSSNPVTIKVDDKLIASFPYEVSENTYVYIYGGCYSASARGEFRASSDMDVLKLYDIEVTGNSDGIKNVDITTATNNATLIKLNGQRVSKTKRGIYIQKGKKVLIK